MAMKLGDKATSDVLQHIYPFVFQTKILKLFTFRFRTFDQEWQPSQPFCKGFNTWKYYIKLQQVRSLFWLYMHIDRVGSTSTKDWVACHQTIKERKKERKFSFLSCRRREVNSQLAPFLILISHEVKMKQIKLKTIQISPQLPIYSQYI